MTKVIILVLLFLSAAFCFIEIKDVSGQENNLSMMGDASMVNQTGTFPPFEKIYIINLKKRLDKRTAMEQRLKDLKVEIPVEFIEAVDGNQIDKKWLLDNNAAPLISWRDPKIKRPLTKGEIGCMLSHIKAWDMIIESGRSGLILEDDAVFSENFLMRVVDLKDDLTENYWELFYFYRQQLRDGEKRVGLNMVLPKYSYLTLSYAVTVEGAKKLRNTPIKQNLIPSDEYLSIMFGQCPLKRYTKLYDDYPKVRALAHLDNDLITPVETSYEDSDTEKSTSVEELFDLPFLHHIPELEDTYFVTVAHTNNIKDEGYRFFERSSNFYGISPLVVQTNEASNDFKIIQSVYSKLKEAHSKLPSPKSKLLVLVCLEAERSFFNADPYTIANSYAEFRDTDIVFASQITNPHKNNEREDFYPNTIHSWKFLSPNLFLSNYQYLVKLFESFLNQDKSNKKPFVDFAADIYFSNLRRAKLDFNCDLFQTIQRNNEILDIFPKNSQITNEVTYTNPQIFHWSLSGLNAALRAANMAGAWTQKKNSHPADPDQVSIDTNSPVSAYPTVFFSLHVHHHLPYLDQVIKHVSTLNYPFQKIHFWIQTNTANHHLVEPKLAPLIAKIKSQKGTYEIVEASPEINFLEARIESFKSAISSKQDLFFTTSSVLLDPNVLLRLVKTGKRAVAPLLNEKRRAFRANVWLNCTETGFYAGSSFYYKIVQSEYNGLWAVPVILNTYLLKSEVLPELASALERRNTQIQNGPIENLYADVEVSRQLTKQLVFPRLINQKSFGNYIQDYTLSLTDIFFRKLDEETWKKKYLVAPDNSVSQANSACSKPGARNNSPVVYRCNAYTPEFSHDFSVETKTFMGSNVHSKLDTSFKKNVFDHFFNDTCLSSFDFVRKHSNFQKSVFSFIAHKSYQPKSTSPVDFSVCNNFPKSCTDDLKAGNVLARMSVCNKEYKVPSLLIRIQLSDDHYLCHCMTPKTHMI